MICIDSDCIIDALRGDEKAANMVIKHKDELVSTELNVFEVFIGIYLKKSEKEKLIAEDFFKDIEILSGENWGKKAAEIKSQLIKKGKEIDQNDCIIASIMLVNGCNKIITRNKNHFSRIEEIEVIEY